VNDAQFDFRLRAHQSQPTRPAEQQPAGDHSDLQYRLNGVILQENISVFGQQITASAISRRFSMRTAIRLIHE